MDEKTKEKIDRLNIKPVEKSVLLEMERPHTIAQVAAELDCAYTSAFGKLQVWEAKGWVKKIKPRRGTIYHLNWNFFQDFDEMSQNVAKNEEKN